MNFVLPENFKMGHAEGERTGVTVIVCEKGAVGGVSVRGGAPGTRETDLLNPYKTMNEVHAVTLSGGSAFGLESASGVMRALLKRNIGFKTLGKTVPIVPAAVIYDLNGEGYEFPDVKMGEAAVDAAFNNLPVSFGCVGVGKGATVAKLRGAEHAKKSGVGGASLPLPGGGTVSAVVAVNALGEVRNHLTGEMLAGCGGIDPSTFTKGTNTTIGCIVTDVKLDKVQANKLADFAHQGMIKTIFPVHTDFDGDTLFALSSGEKVCDFSVLAATAAEAVALSIENAVIAAKE